MRFAAQFAIVLALGAGVPVLAQGDRVLPNNAAKQGKIGKAKGKAIGNGAIIERLMNMTPEQRRQALRQLPPARQREALRTLQALDLLSPEERQVLRGRYQLFASLGPQRQRDLRQEIRALRALPRPERRRRLASEDLRSRFSEEEVQLLYEVMGLPEP